MKAVRINPLKVDWTAFVIMMVLVAFGLVMVYSSSLEVARNRFDRPAFFLSNQAIRFGLALIVFYAALNTDYHWLVERYRIFLAISVVLLLILLVSNGVMAIKGARRWVSFLGLTFQPSDLARISVILYMARMLAAHGKSLGETGGEWVNFCLVPAAVAGLVLLQPNFSTAAALVLIVTSMLFVAGLRISILAAGGLALGVAGIAAVAMAPYRFARWKAFVSPESSPGGYQALQSLIGLGSGGWFGSGLGASGQKHFFLPEPYTDFVFSIIGEELGFLGVCAVFTAFGLLLWRGYRIALTAPDRLGFFLATGITTMIGVYLFVHAGVVSSLLPTTGIPLPFISYGGSNLIANLFVMGVLLNISSQSGRSGFSERSTR